MNIFLRYLSEVYGIFLELSPWLLLGASVAGFLHICIPKNFIQRHLGKPGFLSTFKAALIGVPMPLCSCSVIPTAIGLKKHGAGNGASISFLISTPQTGVDSIAVTAAFLGWPFALFKVGAAFITGIIGGLCAGDDQPVQETTSGPKSCCGPTPSCDKDGTSNNSPTWYQRAWDFAFNDVLHSIWRWLVIGILLSALLSTFIEPGSLHFESTSGIIGVIFLTLLISIPLYVCDISSVPIAAAMVAAGLPTGAALVLLMAGPATNIATIGAVGRGLGRRALVAYLSVVIGGSVIFALIYNWWFHGLTINHIAIHEHHQTSLIATISTALVITSLIWFAIRDMRKLLTRSEKTNIASCCN